MSIEDDVKSLFESEKYVKLDSSVSEFRYAHSVGENVQAGAKIFGICALNTGVFSAKLAKTLLKNAPVFAVSVAKAALNVDKKEGRLTDDQKQKCNDIIDRYKK